MNKRELYYGLGFTLFGIACIVAALLMDFREKAALWGLGGAGLGPGVTIIFKYIYIYIGQGRVISRATNNG